MLVFNHSKAKSWEPGMQRARVTTPPQEVFAKEHAHNSNITWILRAVGWFVLFIGFNVMTRILVIIGKVVWLGVHVCTCVAVINRVVIQLTGFHW